MKRHPVYNIKLQDTFCKMPFGFIYNWVYNLTNKGEKS